MNESLTAPSPKSSRDLPAIGLAGLVAGILDITSAFIISE